MAVLLTTIAAGVVWIVMLSLGVKPFDALMVGIAMVLLAATAHAFGPHLPGARRREKPDDRYTPR
jgi:tetrahydromethanopterin S-methyltransferase subunit E